MAHDPRRIRPAWGALSICTRCGMAITWRGAWKDDQDGADTCEQRDGTPKHHSRTDDRTSFALR